MPLPPNLYIVGTINVDETTNPVSDKVLDRAVVIDMSSIQLGSFLKDLERREPTLKDACTACEKPLIAVHQLMAEQGLGFGYRVAEEVIRYFAFANGTLKESADSAIDHLLVQKVLVKLRGTEKQRGMLAGLLKAVDGLPASTAVIQKLTIDLDEFGSFQAGR
jgi:hypothetical protein